MKARQRWLGGRGDGGRTGVAEAPPRRRRRPLIPEGWPPGGWGGRGDDGDDDGDGGGGGGDGGGGFDPWDGLPRPGTAELAMSLALICICTLFLIFLGLFFLLWKTSAEWPPSGAPDPPEGLWVSTLVLFACSAALARAGVARAREEALSLGRNLLLALGLGLVFLAVQASLWRDLVDGGLKPSSNGYGAIFYALTGLHAAHIAGGLFFLGQLLRQVRRSGDRLGSASALRLVAVYWARHGHHLGRALRPVLLPALGCGHVRPPPGPAPAEGPVDRRRRLRRGPGSALLPDRHRRLMNPIRIARRLSDEVGRLTFAPPVSHVYNPLAYARRTHEAFLKRYARPGVEALLIGMNPGPWGMAQTGVPFGEIEAVRDWMGIEGKVDRPRPEHPKKPVDGFDCRRIEGSGKRLWGWARDRFGSADAFFDRFFVWNYCPLCFLEDGGRNRTPDKLPRAERDPLFEACDRALIAVIEHLGPKRVIGVGRFAQDRARETLASDEVGIVLHPSPASPAANRGWAPQAERQLEALGIALP